jgi:hypothetical protein
MKRRAVNIFLILVFLMVSGWTVQALNGDKQTTELQITAQQYGAPASFRVIDSVTEVKLGGIGFITIQGQVGVKYTVNSSFKTGNDTRSVSQWRVADENGKATFIWSVSPQTVPGTYPVTISGGGSTIELIHTVLP